ncbi:hypothetical protein ACS0TY_012220 [Phlomoides rotata]
MASSSPPTGTELAVPPPSLIYLLLFTNSAAIKEDMEKSKDSVLQRKIDLEEKKDHFQKAAYTVLDMLISRDIN